MKDHAVFAYLLKRNVIEIKVEQQQNLQDVILV
jgi:hypothetical protein